LSFTLNITSQKLWEPSIWPDLCASIAGLGATINLSSTN
jgi:hypothetical protein